jgi:hypothetical protein
MRRLDQHPGARRVHGPAAEPDEMPRGRTEGQVHRLVRLHLTEKPDLAVVLQKRVGVLQHPLQGGGRVLRLPDIGPFSRRPPDDVPGTDHPRDVDRAPRAVESVLPIRGPVRRHRSIDGPRVLPEPGRDEFRHQAPVAQHPPHLGDAAFGLSGPRVRWNHVVVVELDSLKTQPHRDVQLLRQLARLAHRRPKRVGPLMEIPGAE